MRQYDVPDKIALSGMAAYLPSLSNSDQTVTVDQAQNPALAARGTDRCCLQWRCNAVGSTVARAKKGSARAATGIGRSHLFAFRDFFALQKGLNCVVTRLAEAWWARRLAPRLGRVAD